MAAARRRPVIGVTGADSRLAWAWWFTARAVRRAGGTPVRLTPQRPPAARLRLDGLIIGGGDDIDRALYLEEDDGAPPANPARDRLELELIRDGLARATPMLGICRGAQLINVALGGTLHPDIRPRRRKTSNRRTPFPRKTAVLRRSSRLARLCGGHARLRINSLHHQAVDRLGQDLVCVARDLDGFVQAVETRRRGRFLIGVQWHPEYLPQMKAQRRLLTALVRAAARLR